MYLTDFLSISQNKILVLFACETCILILQHQQVYGGILRPLTPLSLPFCEDCSGYRWYFPAHRKWGWLGFLLLPLIWEGKLVHLHCTLYLIVTWKGKHINRALTLRWRRSRNLPLASRHSSQKQCQSLWGTIKGHSNTTRKCFEPQLWWELFFPLPLAFESHWKRDEVSGFWWCCTALINAFLFIWMCFAANTALQGCVNITVLN